MVNQVSVREALTEADQLWGAGRAADSLPGTPVSNPSGPQRFQSTDQSPVGGGIRVMSIMMLILVHPDAYGLCATLHGG